DPYRSAPLAGPWETRADGRGDPERIGHNLYLDGPRYGKSGGQDLRLPPGSSREAGRPRSESRDSLQRGREDRMRADELGREGVSLKRFFRKRPPREGPPGGKTPGPPKKADRGGGRAPPPPRHSRARLPWPLRTKRPPRRHGVRAARS